MHQKTLVWMAILLTSCQWALSLTPHYYFRAVHPIEDYLRCDWVYKDNILDRQCISKLTTDEWIFAVWGLTAWLSWAAPIYIYVEFMPKPPAPQRKIDCYFDGVRSGDDD